MEQPLRRGKKEQFVSIVFSIVFRDFKDQLRRFRERKSRFGNRL